MEDQQPIAPEVARLQLAQAFLAALPHAQALGMQIEALGNGEATLSMAWRPDLVGDPATGVIHGGAVSALMDTCCGAAVMSHPEGPPVTATIDLRIEYMRAAVPGQRITARATCHHVTRSVAFVRAEARDEEGGAPVGMAHGAFTFEGGKGGAA